jgi:hypothetical protein
VALDAKQMRVYRIIFHASALTLSFGSIEFSGMSSSANALLSFWFKPRASMRALIEADAGHTAALTIGATFGAVQSARLYLVAQNPSALTFLYGALCGVFGLYLFGAFFRVSGRAFKGNPKPKSVRTSLGLGLLPWTLLFALTFWLMRAGQDAATIAKLYPLFFVLFLYGYIVLLLSLSVSLGLSLWKTFFCIAVTFIGSLFPLTLLAQLVFATPAT